MGHNPAKPLAFSRPLLGLQSETLKILSKQPKFMGPVSGAHNSDCNWVWGVSDELEHDALSGPIHRKRKLHHAPCVQRRRLPALHDCRDDVRRKT